MTPQPTIPLLDAAAYSATARRYGIRESARDLILTGRLTPLSIGRRTYYAWRELLAAMPPWGRRYAAPLADAHAATGERRSSLTGHTVTVERATRLVALAVGTEPGDLVVAERSEGWLTVPAAIPPGEVAAEFASAYAAVRGAHYIEEH